MASILVLVLVPLAAGSCKQGASNTAIGVVHRGVGVIESIDKSIPQVQIDHEEIKDYMPAMNMPYPVKDISLLEGIQPGDRVEFALQTTTSGGV
ncbi:MAG TPA: copper-binding protein, partial [Blastocatellia bacterium]|nr:copper-binding protein [Blastocatellia bacterium]